MSAGHDASPALAIEGLRVTFPSGGARIPVVDSISLAIARGEVLALVGESGCG